MNLICKAFGHKEENYEERCLKYRRQYGKYLSLTRWCLRCHEALGEWHPPSEWKLAA